jgi:hypothetical protein
VPDFLDFKRQEINDRLTELKPLLDEYNRLQAASQALGAGDSSPTASSAQSAPAKRRPGRPRGFKNGTKRAARGSRVTTKATQTRTPRSRRPGPRKGSGTRSAEALSLITEQPGITILELAAKMDIKQNYLYRVLPALEKEKKIVKRDRGWHRNGIAQAPAA